VTNESMGLLARSDGGGHRGPRRWQASGMWQREAFVELSGVFALSPADK
jgi:hypothetical protein